MQRSSAAQRPCKHLAPPAQSASEAHSGAHLPSAHFIPGPQSSLFAHWGFATQIASRQTGRSGCEAQLESSRHSLQKPLMQTCPCSAQSPSVLHSGYWTRPGHAAIASAKHTRTIGRIGRT